MQRSWWSAVALAGVLVIAGETRAGSKPAGLPANQQIECPDCQEPGRGEVVVISGGSLEVEPAKDEPKGAAVLDTVSPTLVPMYLELLLRQIGGLLVPTQDALGRAVGGASEKAAAQARRFFDLAEFYRRNGHFDSARFYYQRVHSLQPTTLLGRLAIERLTEIEGRLREAEESGAEDPETVYRRMREQTMPLGLVELTY